MRSAIPLVRRLYRHAVAGWDGVRPHTGALVATAVYLVAVYLVGHR